MQKMIKLAKQEPKLMSLEEVLTQFDKTLWKHAHNWRIEQRGKKIYSSFDIDDMYSEYAMALIEAYQTYSATDCFSSYLNRALENKTKRIIRDFKAGKRVCNMSILELDKATEDTDEIGTFEGKEDENLNDLSCKLDMEMVIANLTDTEKAILEFLLKEEKNKNEFAKELGISRPTLNKRIDCLKLKMMDLLPNYFN